MKKILILLFCLSFLIIFNCGQREPIRSESINDNISSPEIEINASLNVKIDADYDNVEITAGKTAFIKGGSYRISASAYGGGILFNNNLDGILFTIPSDSNLLLDGIFQSGGYKSSDGTDGISCTKIFNDNLGQTHTVIIKNGLITSWNIDIQ